MADDIEAQLIDRLKNGTTYALQIDESVDVASQAQLLVFIRYVWENKINEDVLGCFILPERTTGAEIFDVINRFMTSKGLSWENCIGICTDGAKAMTGSRKGFIARVKQVPPNIVATHCVLHREALASKELCPDLNEVLISVVKIVNFIKTRPLNVCIFSAFLDFFYTQRSAGGSVLR